MNGTSRRSSETEGSVVTGGFSNEETRGAYQAWNFIDRAFQGEADRSFLKRCKSPREAFDHLEKGYNLESEVATQKPYNKFHDFTIPSNSNPIEALHALEDTNNQMTEKGMGIPDTFLHARFVRALPDEYGHVKATLSNDESRPGRDHTYGQHAVLHSSPKEGVAVVVLAARASVLLERKRWPKWCATRSWPRSRGHAGPGPRREQQQGWR